MIKNGKIICEDCGKELDYVLIDGYSFGDTLLEGVQFKVRLLDGKWEAFGMDKDSEPYMKGLNWDHWKKECEEFCSHYDIAECPKCGNPGVLIEEELNDQ